MAAADPSAILVPERVLRRVIREDRRLRWLGGAHPLCHVMQGESLGEIVDYQELGRRADLGWPSMALLIAEPDPDELSSASSAHLLVAAWRRLFHARVACELAKRLSEGEIDATGLDTRIAAIGRAAFDEARAVLRQDGLLLPPFTDASAYASFGAAFLELTYFQPSARSAIFPAIESLSHVETVLGGDVDAPAVLAATRPPGAPAPLEAAMAAAGTGDVAGVSAERRRGGRPGIRIGLDRKFVARARAAGERGNHVRAAILWTRAARAAGPEAGHSERAAARAALNRLAVRLRKALFVQKGEASLWVGALSPLLEPAASGFWTPERRLLHDLQNVCLDHEREVFRLEPLAWLISLGRRPLRHPLPHLREVGQSRHLRTALARLPRTRLDPDQRARLEGLLHSAVNRAGHALRERFRARLGATLEAQWVQPANLPERVAFRKLIEELLDPIVARGFTTMGDLRDAASRGNLKLADLASPGEFLRGDRLLQSDRALAQALDGVHRRGEVYLRWLQRLSALAFGTPIGRFLTLYLALPFGGAFVLLKGLDEIYGISIGYLTGVRLEMADAWSVLGLGLLGLGVINFARFRRVFLAVLRAAGHVLRAAFVLLPAWLVDHPLVRRLITSAAGVAAWRFAIKPGLPAAVAWVWARSVGARSGTTGALVAVTFLIACWVFNTRMGRRVEERVVELIGRSLRALVVSVLPGLFHLVMGIFDRLVEWVERVIYAVDEWLRFRDGQSRVMLAIKAVLGLGWGVVAYAVRIYINLLVEPQLNPIKHFPVVTVAAKLLLPFVLVLPGIIAAPLRPFVGTVIADAFAATTVFFLPGVFGFLVWELRANWRLYAANRPRELGPIAVGSHGETVIRFLRPAFHSGTLPKRFARLRRALRAGRDGTALKHREALHHVEEAVRRLVERDFAGLLRESPALAGRSIRPGSIHLATNLIRIELIADDDDAPGPWIELEETEGHLTAAIRRTGWLDRLDVHDRRVLADALAGLYKLSGVDRLRQDAAVNRPDDRDFSAVAIPWSDWVAVWETGDRESPALEGALWRVGILPHDPR